MGVHQRILGMYKRVPPGEIWKSTLICVPFGGFLFTIRQYFNGSENFHADWVMPLVRSLTDAEQAHNLALWVVKKGLYPWRGDNYVEYDNLQTECLRMSLKNPIGLAAGFDKDGEAVDGIRKLGFGFVEIGSVTPYPQSGNPKPRVFRLEDDKAVINRYGFNSIGSGGVLINLIRTKQNNEVPLGINIGKNKEGIDAPHQYTIGMRNFADRCSYLVINVSSPNTPGLRDFLKNLTELREIIKSVTAERRRAFAAADDEETTSTSIKPPSILLKISPDMTDNDLKSIADLCLKCRKDDNCMIEGVIISNTTTSRPDNLKCADQELVNQVGGLSGAPLEQLSTTAVRKFYTFTNGHVPIIGCGGVSSGEDAYRKLRAGASLVQLYTSLVYQGFPVVGKIKRELSDCLKRGGFTNVRDCIGADVQLDANVSSNQRSWLWPFW